MGHGRTKTVFRRVPYGPGPSRHWVFFNTKKRLLLKGQARQSIIEQSLFIYLRPLEQDSVVHCYAIPSARVGSTINGWDVYYSRTFPLK